jgi:thioredoxin-related protein
MFTYLLHLQSTKSIMKKLSIFSALFIGAFAFAQGIKFEESNFTAVLAKAKKENKLVFVDAYTTWCGPCKMMVKNIFPLKSVGDYYNANFVNAKIDMEKGEGLALAKKYDVKAYPTYLFVNGDGELVHRTLGYVEENDFLQFAKDAGDPNKRLATLKQKFENGEKNPEFLKNLAGLTMYNDAAFSGRVMERYFAEKTDFDRDDIQMLLTGAQNVDSPLYKIFQNKKAEISKVITPEKYGEIDKSIKINSIFKKSYNADAKTWNDNYFLAEAQKFLTKDEAEKILKKAQVGRALRAKDIATYEKLTLELNKDTSSASSEELNALAWNYFENVTTKSSLEKAVVWAQESVKKHENYANTDTLANLYNKVGDKKNAKIWAEKSIALGKAAGEDTGDTEKLLKTLTVQ